MKLSAKKTTAIVPSDHERAVDAGRHRAGHPQARGEQRQPRRVDVEQRAADEPEHHHEDERHEEPGRQERAERTDRVGADRRGQLRVGPRQQQAGDQQEDRRQRAAERRPADDTRGGGPARQVARVVGGGVDPAEAVAGHREHQCPDERGGRTAGQRGDGGPVHVVGDQHDVDDGEDAGHPGDDRLHAHDDVEPEDAAAHDERGHDQERDQLGRRPAAPAELVEDLRGRQRGQRDQRRLPADGEDPRQDRGHPVAVDAERGAAQDQRRRGAALARDRDQAAEQERDDDADDAGDDRLPERDAEAQQERAVGQAEDADVGAEPGPEQLPGRALALLLGDDVDAVGLDGDPGRGRASGVEVPVCSDS